MTDTQRYACRVCGRNDLTLTGAGMIRKHASNGKRPGPGNLACSGGSRLPREEQSASATASGGPNPYRAPLPDHVHRFQWGDDDHGHSGSVCTVCGLYEDDVPLPVGYGSPFKSHGHEGEHLPLRTDLPQDRQTEEATCETIPTGSTPPTEESASTATSTSTKGTPSGSIPRADTRGGSAAVNDAFESAAAPRERADQKVDRDSYGRYKLNHPVTGKKQSWQRATTFAKMLQDQYGLMDWQQRMTAKGLSMRPDLLDLISTLDVKNDREQMNKLLQEAKDVAGSKVAANQGTVVHKHTEDVDFGVPLEEVPVRYQADVAAYVAEMKSKKLSTHPNLIERVTAVPDLGVGGTLDRVIKDHHGKYRILDVKTGNMDFGQLEIAIQLAVYAAGVNTAGLYDLGAGTWGRPGFRVETDFALVAHIPFGKGTCDILKVPIDIGWQAVKTASEVRDWRKRKKLFEPYAEADGPTVAPVAVRPPTWRERFTAVSSRGEAAALYTEAVSAGVTPGDLRSLVQAGMEKLASMEERAG